jgi:chemotaxis protein histidine kinase CheA
MHDARYRELFRREASRLLDEMEGGLSAGGAPDFVSLMRRLHTLKGMGATMGASPVVMVAHAAEDLCARGQSEPTSWARETEALLAEAVDRLRIQVDRVANGEPEVGEEGYETRVRAALRTGSTFAFRLIRDMEADPLPAALGENVRSLGGAQAAIAEAFAASRRLRHVVEGPARGEVERLEAALHRVYDELVPLREVAFGAVVPALRRHVRGVGERTGKLAQLIVVGDEVRVDSSLLARLMGPLSTLVSNAVAHGVETEETRRAAGKPRAGRITVSAERVGRTLVILVDDDGAGFGVPRGAPESPQVGVDAGRGVGLLAVRQAIEEMSGALAVDSQPGAGTRVRLELPVLGDLVALTVVEIGGYLLAVRSALLFSGGARPGAPTGSLLGLHASGGAELGLADGRLLTIDRIVDEGEYLVAPPPFPLNRMPSLRGGGVAPDGRIFFLVEP